MILPMIYEVYRANAGSSRERIYTGVKYFEVGALEFIRGRCPTCWNFYSCCTEFIDCNNGYGAWVCKTNLHCSELKVDK